jgi:hypothetical protein
MINLSQDIQSLSTFKRNTSEIIEKMKAKGNPLIILVDMQIQV